MGVFFSRQPDNPGFPGTHGFAPPHYCKFTFFASSMSKFVLQLHLKYTLHSQAWQVPGTRILNSPVFHTFPRQICRARISSSNRIPVAQIRLKQAAPPHLPNSRNSLKNNQPQARSSANFVQLPTIFSHVFTGTYPPITSVNIPPKTSFQNRNA